jgi:hypothetical protein
MKQLSLCLLFAGVVWSANSSAQADAGLNLTGFTCGQYIDKVLELQKQDPQAAAVLTYWAFGYASQVNKNSNVSKVLYIKFNQSLAERCRNNWNEPILAAIASVRFGK